MYTRAIVKGTEKKREKDLRRITGKDIRAALHTSAPIIVTFLVLGTGYGSGTAQFVSVTMLSGGSFLMAGLTALMISARHVFFSISMIGRYSGEGRRKGYLYYALCDETYAMLSKDDGPEGVDVSNYRLLVTLFDQSAWLAGSFLGGWIGTLLTFDSTGIDFAMTALFTTVFIQQWIDNKCHLPAVLGVAATLACRIIFGRDIFLIPAMIINIGVLTAARGRIEPEGGESDA